MNYKRRLPIALKELYAVNGLEEWFSRKNRDRIEPLQVLMVETREYWQEEMGLTFEGIPQHLQADEGIPFFIECQGCWCWWVLLTGNEDPPVIVECLEENAQILACERLSDFIFACAWDLTINDRPFVIQGEYHNESEFLAWLRNKWEEKPRTRLSSSIRRYRFGKKDRRLLLWEETRQFFLSADTKTSGEEALRQMEPFAKYVESKNGLHV
ncbi:hypothetical protein [Polycladomyces subterraneus]|uniref:Uncharacterized protein n=1 Tax=Polycladomyces subterraneus TaxID=1016997 RepID=A0ABT8IRP2_9BACL|nr:hypothetical protein [Polycladomyces subterraneus]MDN4595126.1 hypothetical protein [Polycladomyces subterraneus]